ncbi:MAG: xanthine dehydrogenase family protein subunit M, partial [Chloroflexi bacterium]|nr:xanthine dehydrogenase family protein subunit M [Chloroflexota bacterium]
NGHKAKLLAGGTDILVQLRADRVHIDRLVDIKKVPELNALSVSKKNGLTLGAAVPCCRVYEDKTVQQFYPGLVDAAFLIGGIQIQGRATIGGNLCNASPSGDSIPILIALGATCEIAGAKGRRTVPVEEFCTAPGKTVLKNGEVLVALRLPPPQPRSGAHYLRFIPRNEMDIAIVGVGASMTLDRSKKRIASARIALGAVGPTPIFARAAGDLLTGKEPTEEAFAQAAEAAKAAAKPITDMRGTAKQRVHLVGVLTKRALRAAVSRAQGAS